MVVFTVVFYLIFEVPKLFGWFRDNRNNIQHGTLQTFLMLRVSLLQTPPQGTDKMLCFGFNEVKRVVAEQGTHHSKSASVHGQDSDIWELY